MSDMQVKQIPIADIIPYVNNARTHARDQIDQIAASIREFGFNNPILIDEKKTIIAGHGRLDAAKKLGLNDVPTITLSHLSKAQKKAYILADNRIALNAGWSPDLLKLEFEELKALDFDIELTGFGKDEIESYLNPEILNEGKTDPDDVPEAPTEPITKLGDVWILGNHRLMCGDSTMIDQIDKLMGGEKADMVFTDPPYNLAEKTKGIASDAPSNEQNEKLMNCEWDKNFNFNDFSANIFLSLKDDCSVYICASHFTAPVIWEWMHGNFSFYGYCIWSKPNPFPSLMKKHWAFSSELICYATRGKNTFNYPKSGNALSVWEIAIGEGGLHPTQKPVAVPTHAILHSSANNNIIFDPFGGSGTTLIACEKHNRRCLMMEISPIYCDIIVKRWQKFTGKEDILESSGKKFDEVANGS